MHKSIVLFVQQILVLNASFIYSYVEVYFFSLSMIYICSTTACYNNPKFGFKLFTMRVLFQIGSTAFLPSTSATLYLEQNATFRENLSTTGLACCSKVMICSILLVKFSNFQSNGMMDQIILLTSYCFFWASSNLSSIYLRAFIQLFVVYQSIQILAPFASQQQSSYIKLFNICQQVYQYSQNNTISSEKLQNPQYIRFQMFFYRIYSTLDFNFYHASSLPSEILSTTIVCPSIPNTLHPFIFVSAPSPVPRTVFPNKLPTQKSLQLS